MLRELCVRYLKIVGARPQARPECRSRKSYANEKRKRQRVKAIRVEKRILRCGEKVRDARRSERGAGDGNIGIRRKRKCYDKRDVQAQRYGKAGMQTLGRESDRRKRKCCDHCLHRRPRK